MTGVSWTVAMSELYSCHRSICWHLWDDYKSILWLIHALCMLFSFYFWIVYFNFFLMRHTFNYILLAHTNNLMTFVRTVCVFVFVFFFSIKNTNEIKFFHILQISCCPTTSPTNDNIYTAVLCFRP